MQEMDTKRKDHLPKFVTLETAVQAVRSGDWVDYGFGVGFPELLDFRLDGGGIEAVENSLGIFRQMAPSLLRA